MLKKWLNRIIKMISWRRIQFQSPQHPYCVPPLRGPGHAYIFLAGMQSGAAFEVRLFPPSIGITAPVMKPAFSEQRNAMAGVTSSTVAIRRIGYMGSKSKYIWCTVRWIRGDVECIEVNTIYVARFIHGVLCVYIYLM